MSESDSEGGGGFDLGALLQQAQAMQEQLMAAQAAAADEVVEGARRRRRGAASRSPARMEFLSVHIDPKAVDPDDVEMLEDLVLAAMHDAVAQVNELTPAGHRRPRDPRDARPLGLAWPRPTRTTSARCTPARSRTSSTSSAACPASGRSRRSASRSTC